MPRTFSDPSSFASSRAGTVPSSNQSPTFGVILSRTNERTVSRMSRSSSERLRSMARKSSARGFSVGMAAVDMGPSVGDSIFESLPTEDSRESGGPSDLLGGLLDQVDHHVGVGD